MTQNEKKEKEQQQAIEGIIEGWKKSPFRKRKCGYFEETRKMQEAQEKAKE